MPIQVGRTLPKLVLLPLPSLTQDRHSKTPFRHPLLMSLDMPKTEQPSSLSWSLLVRAEDRAHRGSPKVYRPGPSSEIKSGTPPRETQAPRSQYAKNRINEKEIGRDMPQWVGYLHDWGIDRQGSHLNSRDQSRFSWLPLILAAVVQQRRVWTGFAA
jgi:hypothetical protein